MKKLLMLFCLTLLLAIAIPFDKAYAQTCSLTSPSDGIELVVNASGSVTLYYSYTGGLPLGLFNIQVSNSADFSNVVIDVTNGTNTSYTASGLDPGVLYYWRVRASYPTGDDWIYGGWTSSRTFGFYRPLPQSPSLNATNRSQPLTFSWMPIRYGTVGKTVHAHNIQIDNNSNFSSPEIDVTNLNDSYTASGLNDNTVYYWRVRYYVWIGFAPIDHEWSNTYYFTTGCDAGETPSLSSPANGATGLAQPINLTWSGVPLADNYAIQISKYANFSPVLISASTGTATSYQASDLEDGTTYYWHVGAHECSWGSYSSYRSFTTECPTPPAAVLTSPSNGATGLSMPFLLDWNSVTDADQYQVQVDDNSNFSSPTISEFPAASEYQVVSGLTPGQTYYWHVRVHTACGWGPYSSYRSFTMVCPIPGVPTLELPPDGITDLSQPLTLDWTDVSGATKYHLQLDDDPGFGSVNTNADNIPVSSTSFSGLPNLTQFYWRVRAGNDCGWSGWSDVHSFTTNCPVLNPPSLISPANNDDELDVREDVVLQWSAVSEADDYALQVAEDAGFSTVVEAYVHAFSGYTISYPLKVDTWYYWRVRTNNSCGAGGWSSIRQFKLICPVVGIPSLISPSNNAVNIPQPILLGWSDVSEAIRYHVQVDDDYDFSRLDVDDENLLFSEVTLPTLLEGVNYFWRIQVHNGCQWGEWSETWSFIAGEQTDIAQIIGDRLPENYSLRQNYPNPFNPKTTLEFALPRAEYVTLEIHNILGAKVETLLSQHLSAGYYSVTWDGNNVPSGVYFYTIKAGEFTETRKMTLLK